MKLVHNQSQLQSAAIVTICIALIAMILLIRGCCYAIEARTRQLERIADAVTLSSEAMDYMASVIFELQDRKNILHRESFERKVERNKP